MDPVTRQFFVAQMQLIQNLTTAVQNIQAHQNQSQPPPLAPPALRDMHKEFMSHHPPTYSHLTDPLDADDWLKPLPKSWKEPSAMTMKWSYTLLDAWKG
jgi:hypothetical protein